MLNTILWIVQALTALGFIGAGYAHGFGHEQAKSQQGMQWLAALPDPLRLFVALCDILGGLGVILPALTGILTWLTPLAGALLALLMLLAIGFHLVRREYPNIVLNFILLVLAAAVAYGRFVVAPF